MLKEKIEAIDGDNKTISYNLFDGQISEGYKSLRGALEVIDKENEGIMKWTFEYDPTKKVFFTTRM